MIVSVNYTSFVWCLDLMRFHFHPALATATPAPAPDTDVNALLVQDDELQLPANDDEDEAEDHHENHYPTASAPTHIKRGYSSIEQDTLDTEKRGRDAKRKRVEVEADVDVEIKEEALYGEGGAQERGKDGQS